jgi:RHS repeat-associated protein
VFLVHDTYGAPYGNTGGLQTSFGFTGEWTDGNGLVNLRARSYNPTIGQFFSLDPIEGDMANPMSLNRYAYVQGKVPNMVDPSGMIAETPKAWDACYGQQSVRRI